MTETPQDAVPEQPEDIWHVDFHMSRRPDALSPDYINCQIARGKHPHEDNTFKLEGMASFEAPSIVPPRVGQDLVPYFLYHLDQIKQWLMEEHVKMTWNDERKPITAHVGLPPVQAPKIYLTD